MLGVGTAYLKGAEMLDKKVINKDKYDAGLVPYYKGEAGAPGSVRELVPAFSEELKIEAGASGHDAHTLPPGVTVDTNYKADENNISKASK